MASPINGRGLGRPLILVIVVKILLIVKSFLEKREFSEENGGRKSGWVTGRSEEMLRPAGSSARKFGGYGEERGNLLRDEGNVL